MIPAKFTLLGARRFGEVVSDPSATLDQIEGLFPLTGGIRSVLTTFNGPIVFEKGAKFTSVEPSPLSDVDGYQGLEMIYGLGTGANSILKQTATYSDQLPPSHFPIGEAPGGNLICVNTRGGVYFWNHESPEDGKTVDNRPIPRRILQPTRSG